MTQPRAWYEAAFGAHYPVLYAHRDAREAARCLDLLPRLAPLGSGPVVDLGCGQGRHLDLLDARGVPAVGIDLSDALLRTARESSAARPLVRADMRRIPLGDGCASAVLSLFTAFGYFGPAEAHQPVVAEVGRVLRPGGHWFLDFLDSDRVRRELAGAGDERVRESGPLIVRERRRLAAGPERVVKDVTITARTGCEDAAAAIGVGATDLEYSEEVTLLSLADLDGLARAAGLRRVAEAGNYDGSPLEPGAGDRWLLVYRRPSGREGDR